MMFADVLAFHPRATLCGIGAGTAVPLNVTPVIEALLTVTTAVAGLKE